MKNILLITALLFIFKTKAQINTTPAFPNPTDIGSVSFTPVKPLFGGEYGETSGAYYKDVDNDFAKYIGTWKYDNGTESITITFIKKTKYYLANYKRPIYEDFLVAGYKYVKNGVEIVNTMEQLTTAPTDIFKYNIYSYGIIGKDTPPVCNDCAVGERRISLKFNDPTRTAVEGLSAELILRAVTENGVLKIKANLIQDGNVIYQDGTQPAYIQYNVKFGNYTFTKVN